MTADTRQDLPASMIAAWELARAFWPKAKEPQSEETARAWAVPLQDFGERDLCESLMELAQGHQHFPSLAEWLGVLRERRRAAQARIDSERLHERRLEPGERSVSQAVADFDKSAEDMRSAEKAQASQIMRDTGKDEHWLAQRFMEIDVVGPFEQRARRLIAGEVAPEELGTWWPEEPRQPKGGAESVGAILSRPSPEKPPEPAPEPEPSATDRVMGAELAQRFLAGEKVDVSKLSAGLRRAAREAVIASRAAKATA